MLMRVLHHGKETDDEGRFVANGNVRHHREFAGKNVTCLILQDQGGQDHGTLTIGCVVAFAAAAASGGGGLTLWWLFLANGG
jgi:hypothetical protein